MTTPAAPSRLVVDGRDVAHLEVASTAAARRKGLLGRDGLDGAIWLAPAIQVHSFGMGFDLDVAFVGRDGTVVHAQPLQRRRITRFVWRSRGVIEAEAGSFDRWGLRPGATVDLPGGAVR